MRPRLVRHVFAIASLGAAAACASVVATTPVRGSPTAVDRLVGQWEGEFGSAETGRSGSIVFNLRAGTDTAEGDVLISPRGVRANDRQVPTFATAPMAVGVRFVFVSGNEVSGALDPYRDPDCGCRLLTTFTGTLSGDTIQGTFRSESRDVHHLPSAGWWRVIRREAR